MKKAPEWGRVPYPFPVCPLCRTVCFVVKVVHHDRYRCIECERALRFEGHGVRTARERATFRLKRRGNLAVFACRVGGEDKPILFARNIQQARLVALRKYPEEQNQLLVVRPYEDFDRWDIERTYVRSVGEGRSA